MPPLAAVNNALESSACSKDDSTGRSSRYRCSGESACHSIAAKKRGHASADRDRAKRRQAYRSRNALSDRDWLVDRNLVRKIINMNRVWRFSANESCGKQSRHAHFKRNQCAKIVCLDGAPFASDQIGGTPASSRSASHYNCLPVQCWVDCCCTVLWRCTLHDCNAFSRNHVLRRQAYRNPRVSIVFRSAGSLSVFCLPLSGVIRIR